MNNINKLTLFMAFLSINSLFAQQLPMLTSTREMQTFLNPGAPNADYLSNQLGGSLSILHRRQYSDLPNSISTQILSGNFFNTQKRLLGGINFMHDANGPTAQMSLYANLGYVISADPKHSGIGFGLQAGASQFLIKVNEITFRDVGDVQAAGNIKQVFPDVGWGMFAYSSLASGYEGDRIFGGFSIPQVFGLDLSLRDDADKGFKMTRVRHYYAHAGLIKHLGQDLSIEPTIWGRYVQHGGFQVAANCQMKVGELFAVGAGYDTANQFSINAEVQFLKDESLLRLGYNYTKSLNQITSLFGPSHELKITFSFGNGSSNGAIAPNSRFF